MASKPKKAGGKGKRRRLTPRQEAFAQHYAVHRNASEAYRTAYPKSRFWKPEHVHQEACRLLKRPKVVPSIEELMKRVLAIAEQKFDITAEQILQELAAIAFYNAGDYFEWGATERVVRGPKGAALVDSETGKLITENVGYMYVKPSAQLTRHQLAAVIGAEESTTKAGDKLISIKLGDKRGALKDLGQHPGLFKQDVRLNGGPPIPVVLSSLEAEL